MVSKSSKAPLNQPTGLQAMEKRELESYSEIPRMVENEQDETSLRQMAEISPSESENSFKMFMDHFPGYAILKDEDGRFVYSNAHAQQFLGAKKWEGRSALELLPQEVAERVLQSDAKAQKEIVQEIFPNVPTGDGSQRIYLSIKFPVRRMDRPPLIGSVGVDITRQVEAEEGLRRTNDILERQVEHRTAELVKANERLRHEIKDRRQTERLLRQREQELEIKTARLEEANIAMRVLLKRRHDDKGDVEQSVLYNIKELVEPYLKKIREGNLDVHKTIYLNILEANLKSIASPFVRGLSSRYLKFTPVEIQVANLIKQGKTTKVTAQMMNLSERTIESHRSSIRRKLGIHKQKANLRTHLLSLA
jgi:PAS domain S-box-containing protein